MTRRSSKPACLALSQSNEDDNMDDSLVEASSSPLIAKTPSSSSPTKTHHRRLSSLLRLRSPFGHGHPLEQSASYASSCAATEEESEELEEQEEEEIQLITKPTKASRSAFQPVLNFSAELDQAAATASSSTSKDDVALELHQFIERATRHDIYKLRDLIVQYGTQGDAWKGKTLRIHDTAYATNFRRFAYKKDNLNHHIQALCLKANMRLDYRIALVLDVDDTPTHTVVDLLQEIKKHPEIRHLTVCGHLNQEQERLVLTAVKSLVQLQDRDWDAIHIYTAYCSSNSTCPEDYEAWVSLMQHYMGVFSQLYEQYQIPIDIRPCASD